MDYAWIYRECFEWAVLEVGDLLKNVETKNKYDELVDLIFKHINEYEVQKFGSDGYDVYGYDADGYDEVGYSEYGKHKRFSNGIKNDRFAKWMGTRFPIEKDDEYEVEFQLNNYDDERIERDRTTRTETYIGFSSNGTIDYYTEDLVGKQIEEDYDINLDDMESDYYEATMFGDVEINDCEDY